MRKITILQVNKSQKRVSIFLDDSSSFIIDRQVVEDAGLRKGLDLSDAQIRELMEADIYRRCFDMALRFLAYRPRSELEIRQRMRKRGFNDDTISNVLSRLKEQNLVNDAVFAQYWKDSRLSSNPKSRRLIKHELRRKGIYDNVAEEALGEINDIDNAYKAGVKKARLIASLNYEEFRRKMSNYLKWRGYSYGVISSVSERLWQEKENSLK